MSDFLTNLIARSFAAPPAIQPRLPSLFESAAAPSEAIDADPIGEAGARRAAAPLVAAEEIIAGALDATALARPPSAASEEAGLPPRSQPGVPTPRRESLAPAVATPPTADHSDTLAHPLPHPKIARPIAPPAASILPVLHPPAVPFVAVAVSAKHPRAPHSVEPRPAAAGPTIHVTIGRVDVRAVQSPPPAPKAARRAAPKLSLDEYLQPRSGGAR